MRAGGAPMWGGAAGALTLRSKNTGNKWGLGAYRLARSVPRSRWPDPLTTAPIGVVGNDVRLGDFKKTGCISNKPVQT